MGNKIKFSTLAQVKEALRDQVDVFVRNGSHIVMCITETTTEVYNLRGGYFEFYPTERVVKHTYAIV